MESGVTLITTTGYRPEAFDLCKEYVWRQTYSGPLQWIIVDDGHPPMPFNPDRFVQRGIEIQQVFPLPSWIPGQNTLARNLLAAIPVVKYDKVFFIEDDDWYAPDYLDAQIAHMGEAMIVGETHAIYYNVKYQLFAPLNNTQHASMCQTGMHASGLPVLKKVCQTPHSIDLNLWGELKAQGVLYEGHRCVGIKGLPGRAGLGMGHRPPVHWVGWGYDGEWRQLKALVGDDYLHYRAIAERSEKEGDFEIFYWSGQKRYRCNQTWESGIKCEFDTFDYRALLDHVSSPHTYSGKRAPVAQKIRSVSPIVGPNGEEIIHEGDD